MKGIVRDRLAAVCGACIASFALVAPTHQSDTRSFVGEVSGSVYVDVDGNRQRDPGERGIAGVAVSDQVNVVLTDAQGRYRFPEAGGLGVVYVTQPVGYRPIGSFWRAVLDRNEPQQIDFPFAVEAQPSEFTFIHASDTHVSEESVDRVRKLRGIVEERRPAFVIVTGDLVRDALRVPESEATGYYQLYLSEIAQFPVPVWSVPGNHENFGIERHKSLVSPTHPLYGKKMYRKMVGPTYYSFNYGSIHFIGLDSVDYEDLWYYGHVDEIQLGWLERDVATLGPNSTVVTFNHIPLMSAAPTRVPYTDSGLAPTLIRVGDQTLFRHIVSNHEDVQRRLATTHYTLALGGHFHYREMVRVEGVETRFFTTAAVVGPAGDFPSGVVLYRVRGNQIDDGEFIPLDHPGG